MRFHNIGDVNVCQIVTMESYIWHGSSFHVSHSLIIRGNSPDAIALTISREADTCDPEDYIIDDGTTHILYLIDDDQWGREAIEGYETNKVEIKGFNRVQVIKVSFRSNSKRWSKRIERMERFCSLITATAVDLRMYKFSRPRPFQSKAFIY